jgi:hypothetical protein
MYPNNIHSFNEQIYISSDSFTRYSMYGSYKISPNRKERKTKKYQKIKGKKPVIHSKYCSKYGVSTLKKQKIKNCFKWQKIKKKVRKI